MALWRSFCKNKKITSNFSSTLFEFPNFYWSMNLIIKWWWKLLLRTENKKLLTIRTCADFNLDRNFTILNIAFKKFRCLYYDNIKIHKIYVVSIKLTWSWISLHVSILIYAIVACYFWWCRISSKKVKLFYQYSHILRNREKYHIRCEYLRIMKLYNIQAISIAQKQFYTSVKLINWNSLYRTSQPEFNNTTRMDNLKTFGNTWEKFRCSLNVLK